MIYYYEFQQRPSMFMSIRPGFVKADHFDEVGFVFGAPFWTDDIVMLGTIFFWLFWRNCRLNIFENFVFISNSGGTVHNNNMSKKLL